MASSPDDLIKLHVTPSAEEAAAVMQSLRDHSITARLEQPAGITDCLTMASPMFEVSVRRADLAVGRDLIAGDREPRTEWAAACEQCGYSLAGLKAPARCPECGWNAAEHGRDVSANSTTRDLAQARAKLAPRATGYPLIVIGILLALAGATIALMSPHSVEYYWQWGWGGSGFRLSQPRGGSDTPAGYNVGVPALITLGLIITLLGIRDLRRR